jgi:hypothetical protein
VDGGDFCPPPTEPNKLKAQLIREVMDDLGYDVMALGERELAFGHEYLLSLTEPTEMRVLSANILHGPGEKKVGEDYAILDVGGVKVGFLSLYFHQPRAGKMDHLTKEGFVPVDAVEAAGRILPRLHDKSDMVVLLAHGPWTKIRGFLDEVSDFDFVISVHEGALDRTGREINETTLMKAGNRGQNIGKVTFVVDPEGVVELSSTETIPVKTSLPQDPDVTEKIRQLNLKYNEMRRAESLARRQGGAHKREGNRYLGDATCRRCHEDIYQIWMETPHAAAYESLKEEGRHADSDCVECHTTGHGEATGFLPPSPEELKAAATAPPQESTDTGPPNAGAASVGSGPELTNVQCEACHGKGTDHARGESSFRKVSKSECARCHDEDNSPDFNYGDYLPHVSCSRLLEEAG